MTVVDPAAWVVLVQGARKRCCRSPRPTLQANKVVAGRFAVLRRKRSWPPSHPHHPEVRQSSRRLPADSQAPHRGKPSRPRCPLLRPLERHVIAGPRHSDRSPSRTALKVSIHRYIPRSRHTHLAFDITPLPRLVLRFLAHALQEVLASLFLSLLASPDHGIRARRTRCELEFWWLYRRGLDLALRERVPVDW